MEYVDGGGGGYNWQNSTEWVGRYIDIVIIAVTGGIGAFSIYSAKNYIRSLMGKTVTRVIKNKLMGYVGSAVAGLFTSALDIALVIAGTSIGGMIAEGMDRLDGRNDGYVCA